MVPNKNHKYRSTVAGRATILISNAKRRCKDKNVEFHLTREWVEERLVLNTCEITGMSFSFEPPPNGLSRRIDAPSLDRIDKNKNYTEENTRVILWGVNCALSEYGTEMMLPILKATVNGIENAKQKSTTPVPTGTDQQGEVYPELGSFSATGTWQDGNNPDNHCGADAREDANHSTEEGSGDSVGRGDKEVGTPQTLDNGQMYGDTSPALTSTLQLNRHINNQLRERCLVDGTEPQTEQFNNR
jgi:hypothetical protein